MMSTKSTVNATGLIFSLLYNTVFSRDQVRKNTVEVITIRSRTILEAYRKIQLGLIFSSKTAV